MSYLETPAYGPDALEPHERVDLAAWLKALEDDCEIFGATPEDEQRMRAIKSKIEERPDP